MDELPVQRDTEEQDADSPLARDDASWFARLLGEEWRTEEPGIYRFVGPKATPSNARASADANSTAADAGAGSEVDEPKAKSVVGDAQKHAKTVPAEAEALKRKAPATLSDMLKTKGGNDGVLDKQRFAPAESVALKEKLAAGDDREHPS